ncbi:hypothetical protein DXB45_02445 [Clostridium sp. OM04-12AA]|nr:hypothetical protein DXB45_02445 [Clostridium sp. OM04-12AA]
MFDWNLYVPDFVRGFFVICVQIFEAYVDKIWTQLAENQPQRQVHGRLQSNITQPAGLTKWAALSAQPKLWGKICRPAK